MAALISKNGLLLTNRQTVRVVSSAIKICNYSDGPTIIKDPSTASLKRGTGGRSSFNGIVCTVFGCTGFLGRYIVNGLGKIGTQLILPYRGDQYDTKDLKLAGDLGQVLFHPFSLRDEDSIRKCIKYSSVVINCINLDFETGNFKYRDVNVEGARRLAKISKEMGVERFIHFSCAKASPNPRPAIMKGGSVYIKSKWESEQAVREEFPEAIIIRPATIYGQGSHIIDVFCSRKRRFINTIPLWRHGLETEVQPVFVSDVAEGVVNIVKNPKISGQTYQFLGPHRYTLRDFVFWMVSNTMYRSKDEQLETQEIFDDIFWNVKYAFYSSIRRTPVAGLHRESLEWETLSDNVVKGLPTLEDLGLKNLVEIEDQIPWEVKHFHINSFYTPDFDQMDEKLIPRRIPVHAN